MNVFYIPTGYSFLETLAKSALRLYGETPEHLADLHILLPTRRAVRMMADIFLDLTNGAPMILPRLRAVADIDDAELELWVHGATRILPDIHPAISNIERQAVLTQMLQKRDPTLNYARASGMARALGELMDRVADEDLSLDAMDHLVPSEYAAHWQLTVEFLSILRTVWPTYLEDRKLQNATTRRSLLLRTLAAHWAAHPPASPIWIAGVTGSLPAVADLMRVIANCPNGHVILSGFDPSISDDAKEDLQHPHYQTHQTLSRLSISPHDVRVWPEYPLDTADKRDVARGEFWNHVLCTNIASDRWTELKHAPNRTEFGDVLSGLRLISCKNRPQEARIIAAAARHILSDQNARLAIVTPDRALAQDIISACARFKIDVNDSAGDVLSDTAPARFMFLCLKTVMGGYHPVDLLSLLRDPFFNPSLLSREAMDRIDRLSRGVRPPAHVDGLMAELIRRGQDAKYPVRDALSTDDQDQLAHIFSICSNFERTFCQDNLSVLDRIRAHITLAEQLSAHDDHDVSALWTEDDGITLARFFQDLLASADMLPKIVDRDYVDFLADMMSGIRVNARGVGHPRLALLGIFESRLISCTHVILAGMNEGIWPQGPRIDPWLSRRMRQDFGLPLDDIQTGRMAHDFLQLVRRNQVIMTRSEQLNGEITVSSRWWQRLETVIHALGYNPQSLAADDLVAWVGARDAAQKTKNIKVMRPMPTPPCHLRPRKISATNIDLLIKNPYAFYARHILRLFPLDGYDMDVDGRIRGIILHRVTEKFISSFQGDLPGLFAPQILEILSDVLRVEIHDPVVRATLWPRLERVLLNFLDQEKDWRSQGFSSRFLEQKWHLNLDIQGEPYTITARFDRLDQHRDGAYALVDYKTSASIPSKKDALNGAAAQIPIEIWLARDGKNQNMAEDSKGMPLAYALLWPISARKFDLHPWDKTDVEALCQIAARDVPRILSAYHNDHTPYLPVPDPSLAPDFDDYTHLARRAEWWGMDRPEGGVA